MRPKLLTAKNIQRPQLKWLDKIDNSNRPFIPYIKYKTHAVKPLDQGKFGKKVRHNLFL